MPSHPEYHPPPPTPDSRSLAFASSNSSFSSARCFWVISCCTLMCFMVESRRLDRLSNISAFFCPVLNFMSRCLFLLSTFAPCHFISTTSLSGCSSVSQLASQFNKNIPVVFFCFYFLSSNTLIQVVYYDVIFVCITLFLLFHSCSCCCFVGCHLFFDHFFHLFSVALCVNFLYILFHLGDCMSYIIDFHFCPGLF